MLSLARTLAFLPGNKRRPVSRLIKVGLALALLASVLISVRLLEQQKHTLSGPSHDQADSGDYFLVSQNGRLAHTARYGLDQKLQPSAPSILANRTSPLSNKTVADSSSQSTGAKVSVSPTAAENDIVLAGILRTANLSSKVRGFLAQPIINPHNYGFLVNQTHACSDPSLEVVFIIPSSPGNHVRRDGMRNSPIKAFTKAPGTKSIMLFFIARSTDASLDAAVMNESKEHGDIVLIDYVDEYRHILVKMVSMLKWVSLYCSHVRFVIRNDDDITSNNLDTSIKALQATREQNFIMGRFRGANSSSPHRNIRSKYYVSEKDYSGKFYPNFCHGGFVGFTGFTVKLLYEASLRAPSIWLDDVYITGICAEYIEAKKIFHPSFDFGHKMQPLLTSKEAGKFRPT